MSRLTPDDIRHIAALAQLHLDDGEVALFADHFARILERLERLAEVDTDGVEPLAHPLPIANVLRDDVPVTGLSRQDALRGAPRERDGQFAVPAVLSDEPRTRAD